MHCAAACSSAARLPPAEWPPLALLSLGTEAGLVPLLHPAPSRPSTASTGAASATTPGPAPARRRRAGGGACLIVDLPGRTVDGERSTPPGITRALRNEAPGVAGPPRPGWGAGRAGATGAPACYVFVIRGGAPWTDARA